MGNELHCKKRQCANERETSEDFGIWLEIVCSWNKFKKPARRQFFSESEETIKNIKWCKNKDFKDILGTFFSSSTLSFQPHTKRTNHFSRRKLSKTKFSLTKYRNTQKLAVSVNLLYCFSSCKKVGPKGRNFSENKCKVLFWQRTIDKNTSFSNLKTKIQL